MIYAAGEIFLIVIGILIALQITNLNETRKNKIEEKEILTNLEKELCQNQVELQSVVSRHEFVASKTRELAELIAPNAEAISMDRLDTLFYALIYIPKYRPSAIVLSYTKLSGKLSLVEDHYIKLLVASWQKAFEDYNHMIVLNHKHVIENISPFVLERYPLKNIGWKGELGGVSRSKFVFDSKPLLTNPVLENMAELRRINSEILLTHARELMQVQQEIITQIQINLESA